MPWQSQSGNGGGSGGGGPWGGGSGGGSGGGGPWGSGPGGGGGPWGRGGGPGGGRPPDLEDFIRKGQDRIRRLIPGGGGGKGIAFIALILIALWVFSGFYRVQPDQVGVELLFGKWDGNETSPGLNWHWPYPIEVVERPSVERISSIDIGFRSVGQGTRGTPRDVEEESLMLTGDQNIIDIDFTIQWKISDAGRYLFEIRDPEATVKIAAEAAMREIIGRTDIQPALTESRREVEADTKALLQIILTEYEAGIEITELKLQNVQPPPQVIDAFDDVQRAQQDRDRQRNEADSYRNDILPRARGEAQRMIQEAEAYKERLVNEADGEAQRFLSVFEAYLQNPEVTRRRMYLETMQGVLSASDKVILDENIGGVIPYLPLNELRGRSGETLVQ